MDWETTLAKARQHHQAGRLPEATCLYQAILVIDPTHPTARHATARIAETTIALAQAEARITTAQWPEAETAARHALTTHPNHPEAWFLLATTLYHQGRMEESLAATQHALANDPNGRRALTCQGHALRILGRLTESETALRRVLHSGPDDFAAHNNLSLTLEAQGRFAEALDLQQSALRLAPHNEHCLYNQGTMLLRAGHFTQGWPGHEHRTRLDPTDPTYARHAPHLLWQGEPLHGRRILLTLEQGAGDAIMFARYAPLLARQSAHIIMSVPPALRRLFLTLPGIHEHTDPDAATPAFDLHCPLLSLPHRLGTTLATIPANIPYLHPDPTAATSWSARLETSEPGPRVGLVWAGNPDHHNDRHRSIPFAALHPLLACENIRWFSLQVGPRAADAQAHPALHPLTPDLTDFAETAAAIQALDLVIAVDTSTAHLAGALGRRVWTLLPHVADWRWLTARETTPWYPTMRLFRQAADRTWHPVIARVAAELTALANSAAPPSGN